jgi:hypothetical protein
LLPTQPKAGEESKSKEEHIMKLAIVPVLLGVLSGTAFAAESVAKPAPQGYVTILEVPVIFVEARRWTVADEQALQKLPVAKVVSVEAAGTRRDVAYAAR